MSDISTEFAYLKGPWVALRIQLKGTLEDGFCKIQVGQLQQSLQIKIQPVK